jgi:hypothetical protein
MANIALSILHAELLKCIEQRQRLTGELNQGRREQLEINIKNLKAAICKIDSAYYLSILRDIKE